MSQPVRSARKSPKHVEKKRGVNGAPSKLAVEGMMGISMQRLSHLKASAMIAAAMLVVFAPAAAEASKDRVLYAFSGGSDGSHPLAGLIADAQGNFYGTTENGGGENDCDGGYGCGTVFKLASDGTETVLHTFTGGADGSNPHSTLVMDMAGNLYGTTFLGGVGNGVVFKISPAGEETVLYSFLGGDDGAIANAGLIIDTAGHLYGTTVYGGAARQGTVFELTARGSSKACTPFRAGRMEFNRLRA
jgi:uncharacterized repeat protein (TIGR03803 family)